MQLLLGSKENPRNKDLSCESWRGRAGESSARRGFFVLGTSSNRSKKEHMLIWRHREAEEPTNPQGPAMDGDKPGHWAQTQGLPKGVNHSSPFSTFRSVVPAQAFPHCSLSVPVLLHFQKMGPPYLPSLLTLDQLLPPHPIIISAPTWC
jgi:hypothetical protein